MNILYIASTCSDKKYKEYVESKGQRVSQQAQKYNLLLAQGLVYNGSKVKLISSRPINRNLDKRLWFGSEKETEEGIAFSYVPFVNYPVLRNLFVFFGVFFCVLFSSFKRKNTAVICDALNIVATLAALMASTVRGFKTVGIVTDVPCYFSNMENIPLYQKLNLAIMRKFKGYLLLTEQMSDIVNPKKRPYIVLEGHADESMANVQNILEEKAKKRICMYAGSLKKIYGIENLVLGFINAGIPDTELHIYGNGDYVEDLKELSKQYDNVKYLGIAPNNEIVEAELRATLLVNPRPTNEEYTKYSFPSKNMEYMASGTPVLTTRLPGMPQDHEDYVFFIEEETSKGISDALKKVFENSDEYLHDFGSNAKAFIILNKNNKIQASKVIDFMKNHLDLEA